MKNLQRISVALVDISKKEKVRRDITARAGEPLHTAKRAIFALVRGDFAEAKMHIAEAEKHLLDLQQYAKTHAAETALDGAYRAALEEFVEARTLFSLISPERMTENKKLRIPNEVYLSGVLDVPGEIYRIVLRLGPSGDTNHIRALGEAVDSLMGAFAGAELTSYLRNKLDQAKHATHKLEEALFHLHLRS